MYKESPYLVIGAGIAGLSYALKVAEYGKVIIITKSSDNESNTKYAQGGIAAVTTENDSFDKHIEDTLIAGDGLCDEKVVENVVKEGPVRLNELINYGISFDKNAEGNYDLAKEGGHSENRILHYKDITGFEIERMLLKAVEKHSNITFYDHYFVVDLITQHHLSEVSKENQTENSCFGVYAFNTETKKVDIFQSEVTVLATGGLGHIYSSTTNPSIATGDGTAMVCRAKGKVRNMEFIQFHPTALFNPIDKPAFLISEAVRGFGGILRRKNGESFMEEYDVRGSLAPRDIVARAIDNELKKSGSEYVYLDSTHRNKKELLQHFPNIYEKCLSIGLDMSKDYIPVRPAAHYSCGGIWVDENGKTSINNLYACGECASTGLHGANRLASNSLLEAIVYAHRIYLETHNSTPQGKKRQSIRVWDDSNTELSNEDILVTHNLKEIQDIMNNYVGIVRSDFRLERALRRVELLKEETEDFYRRTKLSVPLCELRNVIQNAYLVIQSAMLRKESRGLHYTTDYPDHSTELKDSIL